MVAALVAAAAVRPASRRPGRLRAHPVPRTRMRRLPRAARSRVVGRAGRRPPGGRVFPGRGRPPRLRSGPRTATAATVAQSGLPAVTDRGGASGSGTVVAGLGPWRARGPNPPAAGPPEPWWWRRRPDIRARWRAIEEAVPEALDVLRATVAAGVAPGRALQAAAQAAPEPLGSVLTTAVRQAALGAGAGHALAAVGTAEHNLELVVAGEALDLAEATGAPPAAVLAGVASAAADRVRTRQARLAATAQARLSARVVAAMAPGFLMILTLTAPSDAAFLVERPVGWAALAAAAALEGIGVWWAGRIVNSRPAARQPAPRWWRAAAAPGPHLHTPPGRRLGVAGGRLAAPRGLAATPAAQPRRRLLILAGATAAGLAVAGGVRLVLAPALVVLGAFAVVRTLRRRSATRVITAQAEAAPAAIDLLGACLLAGLNPYLAVCRVAERCPPALRDEFARVAAELRLGRPPGGALHAAAERTGLEELRAAAGAIEAAERWGMPPAEALAARAEALRSRARLRAEADAGRAAVRLAFPLVFCFLPAFVLLTVLPTVAGSFRTLTS